VSEVAYQDLNVNYSIDKFNDDVADLLVYGRYELRKYLTLRLNHLMKKDTVNVSNLVDRILSKRNLRDVWIRAPDEGGYFSQKTRPSGKHAGDYVYLAFSTIIMRGDADAIMVAVDSFLHMMDPFVREVVFSWWMEGLEASKRLVACGDGTVLLDGVCSDIGDSFRNLSLNEALRRLFEADDPYCFEYVPTSIRFSSVVSLFNYIQMWDVVDVFYYQWCGLGKQAPCFREGYLATDISDTYTLHRAEILRIIDLYYGPIKDSSVVLSHYFSRRYEYYHGPSGMMYQFGFGCQVEDSELVGMADEVIFDRNKGAYPPEVVEKLREFEDQRREIEYPGTVVDYLRNYLGVDVDVRNITLDSLTGAGLAHVEDLGGSFRFLTDDDP